MGFTGLLISFIGIGILSYKTQQASSATIKTRAEEKLSFTPKKVEGFTEIKSEVTKTNNSTVNIKSITQTNTSTITTNLPITGQWHGSTVKIVSDDRFFPQYNHFTYYGVYGIGGLRDGRVLLGGLNAFAIKDPSDTEWQALQLVVIPSSFNLQGFVARRIIETNAVNSDKYFMADLGVIRYAIDGSISEVRDSTGNHLNNLKDIATYGENGMVGFKDGPSGWSAGKLVYMEGSTIREWLTPRPNPNINSDQILGIFNDPFHGDNTTFYAFYRTQSTGTYLYQFRFSSDPQVPLEVTQLGTITLNGAGGPHFTKLTRRFDDPSKILLYAISGNTTVSNAVTSIQDFQPSASSNIFTVTYFPNQFYSAGQFSDFVIQSRPQGNVLFLSSGIVDLTAMYYAQGFDNQGPITTDYMRTPDRNQLLANPYTNYSGIDMSNNVLVGSQYLHGQFNNALMTIFEPPATATPTLTPTPTVDFCRANMDGTGSISAGDFSIYRQEQGLNCRERSCRADIDCSSVVGVTDFSILRAHFGSECPAATPIPCIYPTLTPTP